MNWKENRLVRYLYEAKSELQRTTWPTRQETIKSTLVVIGVSVGVAAFLGGVDFGLSQLLNLLIARR
jgi:preprotein translocase subunit SecE